MSYGEIKIDTITFTAGGVDTSIAVSGLVQNPTFTGNVTTTGTITANVVVGTTTVSGATVTGNAGQFTTATITSGVFASGDQAFPSVSVGTTDNGFYSPGADQLAISTNGTGRLTIDSSGNINIDSGTVYVDAANNRLGVGTTSPGDKLAVSDGTNITELSGYSVYFKSDSTGYLQAGPSGGSSGRLVFQTNAVERLRIDSSGRMLVGVTSTSADSRAIIEGRSAGSTGNGVLYLSRGSTPSTNGNPLGTLNFSDSGHIANAAIEAVRDGATYTSGSDQPAALTFSTTADGTATLSERVRIDAAGQVGIGTTTVNDQLHLYKASASSILRIENTGNGNTSGIFFVRETSSGTGKGGANIHVESDTSSTNASLIFGLGPNISATGAEAMRLDPGGRLLIGNSATVTVANIVSDLQSVSTGRGRLSCVTYVNSANGPLISLGKSRGATVGSNAIVLADDSLGGIRFAGDDGTDLVSYGGEIECLVDGTPGANDMPGRLVFKTTSDGSATPTERMRIDSSGRVGIGTSSPGGNLTVTDASTYTLNVNANAGGAGALLSTVGGSASLALGTNSTERVRITAAGNVGIGTTSPGAKLDVNGKTIVGSDSSNALEVFSSGDTEIGFSYSSKGNIYAKIIGDITNASPLGGELAFQTATGGSLSERVRIDSSGRLLVGTTSSQCAVSTLKSVDTNNTGHFQTFAFSKSGLGQDPTNTNIIAVTLPNSVGISVTIMLNVRLTAYQNTNQGGERSATYCINLMRISCNGGSATNAVQANVSQIGSDIATSVGSYSVASLTVSVNTGSSSTGSVIAYIRISGTSTSGASDTRVYMSGYSMGTPNNQPTIAAA